MAGKIAKIEELLQDTIQKKLSRTSSGALFKTKEEAISSLIAMAVLMVTPKSVESIGHRGCAARTVRLEFFQGRILGAASRWSFRRMKNRRRFRNRQIGVRTFSSRASRCLQAPRQ